MHITPLLCSLCGVIAGYFGENTYFLVVVMGGLLTLHAERREPEECGAWVTEEIRSSALRRDEYFFSFPRTMCSAPVAAPLEQLT